MFFVMGWYRRLIYDAFRRCNRSTSPVKSFFSRSNPARSRISQPILRNSALQNVVKNNQKKMPNFFAKRFYSASADRNKVNHHLKANEFGRWYENQRNLIRLGLLGCGATCVYYWNLETVPYTNRRQFVLVSNSLEKKLGEFLFKGIKSYVIKEKILASDHPQSIRVEKIGQELVGAMLKGLRNKEQSTSALLEEFNWEFIVVVEPATVNAACVPGGKIIVYTGILLYLKTDAEIANIIGHEIGHAVARHAMSGIYWVSWLPILRSFMSDRFRRMSDLFLRLPLSRRYEIEADYIGMLVAASAGYDPRTALEVCMKLDKLDKYSPSAVNEYGSTHPHERKRAQLLSQPKVMEEALSIYREALKEKGKDKEGERGYLNFLNRFIGSFLNF